MCDKETCQENTVWYLEHRLRHNLGVKCVTDMSPASSLPEAIVVLGSQTKRTKKKKNKQK